MQTASKVKLYLFYLKALKKIYEKPARLVDYS